MVVRRPKFTGQAVGGRLRRQMENNGVSKETITFILGRQFVIYIAFLSPRVIVGEGGSQSVS